VRDLQRRQRLRPLPELGNLRVHPLVPAHLHRQQRAPEHDEPGDRRHGVEDDQVLRLEAARLRGLGRLAGRCGDGRECGHGEIGVWVIRCVREGCDKARCCCQLCTRGNFEDGMGKLLDSVEGAVRRGSFGVEHTHVGRGLKGIIIRIRLERIIT